MNVFSLWIISILGAVLVGVVSDVILSGRLKNFCRSVFSALTVLIIVMPIPAIVKNGCGSVEEIFDASFPLDNGYISASTDYIAEQLARGITDSLEKEGISGIELKVILKQDEFTEIEAIKIYIKKLVIENGMLHINKYEYLKKKVTEFSNVAEEMIYIYE